MNRLGIQCVEYEIDALIRVTLLTVCCLCQFRLVRDSRLSERVLPKRETQYFSFGNSGNLARARKPSLERECSRLSENCLAWARRVTFRTCRGYLPNVVLDRLHGVDLPNVVLKLPSWCRLTDVVLNHLHGVDLPNVVLNYLHGVDLPKVVLDHLHGVDLPNVVLKSPSWCRLTRCVKHTTSNRRSEHHLGLARNLAIGASSSVALKHYAISRDPFYAHSLQAERVGKFSSPKPTFIRYAAMAWMVEQGFQFSHELDVQGAIKFLELNDGIYSTIVREFCANLWYKDGVYTSLIKGYFMTLNSELFMAVRGIASDRHTSKRLSCMLAYETFISRMIDHLGINTSGEEIIPMNPRECLVGDNLIHKMNIYKYGAEWMYEENLGCMEQRFSLERELPRLSEVVSSERELSRMGEKSDILDLSRLLMAKFRRQEFQIKAFGYFSQPPQPPPNA
ncbi:hypothetical protein Lal_00003955 [Lupinus albus]|nr:hypothetical protein Lal_00003955 [Lupinus albus]